MTDKTSKSDKRVIWQLFRTFFMIGGFTFGGGQAMLQLIREEIVTRHGWLTDEEFLDIFAVAQSLPGVFAVNVSVFVGYRIAGIPGAIMSALGTTLPSFIIILIIAMYLAQYRENEHVMRVFKGIRPAVIALIAAPVISVWRTMKMGWKPVWIPTLVALAVWLLGVSPIVIIILAGFAGWLYTIYLRPHIYNKKR